MLYIAPIQYNLDTDRWVNYNEATWDKRPWITKMWRVPRNRSGS